MLIENAIKHNIFSDESPLTIEIYKMNSTIVIKNNIQKLNSNVHSNGIGINNIKKRYRLLCDGEVNTFVR